jgi:hypothetical protein
LRLLDWDLRKAARAARRKEGDGVDLVCLSPERLLGRGLQAGDCRHFRTVEDAVIFAMEHLSREDRDTSWIRTPDGSLTSIEIERRYRELER